jgi:hypothetical protein
MGDYNLDQLREAVERMHGGTAAFAQSVPVRETFEGKSVWEGVVQISRAALSGGSLLCYIPHGSTRR